MHHNAAGSEPYSLRLFKRVFSGPRHIPVGQASLGRCRCLVGLEDSKNFSLARLGAGGCFAGREPHHPIPIASSSLEQLVGSNTPSTPARNSSSGPSRRVRRPPTEAFRREMQRQSRSVYIRLGASACPSTSHPSGPLESVRKPLLMRRPVARCRARLHRLLELLQSPPARRNAQLDHSHVPRRLARRMPPVGPRRQPPPGWSAPQRTSEARSLERRRQRASDDAAIRRSSQSR